MDKLTAQITEAGYWSFHSIGNIDNVLYLLFSGFWPSVYLLSTFLMTIYFSLRKTSSKLIFQMYFGDSSRFYETGLPYPHHRWSHQRAVVGLFRHNSHIEKPCLFFPNISHIYYFSLYYRLPDPCGMAVRITD